MQRAVTLAAVVCAFAVASSPAVAAPPPVSPAQQVATAIAHRDRTAVLALLRQHNSVALDRALLSYAVVTVSDSGTPPALPTSISYGGGCHYTSFSSTHTISIPYVGLDLGQQRIRVYGYCWTASWSGGKIYWTGGHAPHRWAQIGFCWQNTQDGDFSNPYPHWRTAFADGTLGANYIFGCQGLQYDVPWIDYAAGGGIFRH